MLFSTDQIPERCTLLFSFTAPSESISASRGRDISFIISKRSVAQALENPYRTRARRSTGTMAWQFFPRASFYYSGNPSIRASLGQQDPVLCCDGDTPLRITGASDSTCTSLSNASRLFWSFVRLTFALVPVFFSCSETLGVFRSPSVHEQ